MNKPRFKRPDEITRERDTKVPVSCRIEAATREFLEKEAKSNELSLALLLANVVEDYAVWLKEQGKSDSRRK
ncbi:MAG: hypothetical protein P4M08_02585 [Oligoflexia bacterium]|nr:hypothetical protein [Oligoflexia bacterium]